MKIVFEGKEYYSESFDDLQKKYPESNKLISFINNWQLGHPLFQFNTSGSTGTPKSIGVSRKQIVASVRSTSDFLNLNGSDRALLSLDPNFVASLMMAARCLVLDMDLVLQKPTANPLKNNNLLVDFASFVPFQIYKMIEEGTISQLASIRNILIGGAPLSPSAFRILSTINTNIYLTYGMTETVSHIALMRINGDYENAYYEVIPSISVDTDEDNCLNLIGEVTNNQMVQTNDIVELIAENKFRWRGRHDHVINSGGIKIQPEQLEFAITQILDRPSEFIISWEMNEKLGSRCVLISEGNTITKKDFEHIQLNIKAQFSKYHVPKALLPIDAFERTNSGKIKREETRLKALELL